MRRDRDYYYRRAEAELEQAQRSTSAEAVKIHYTLAGHYLDRVYNDGSGDGGMSFEGVASAAMGVG